MAGIVDSVVLVPREVFTATGLGGLNGGAAAGKLLVGQGRAIGSGAAQWLSAVVDQVTKSVAMWPGLVLMFPARRRRREAASLW